MFQPTPEPWRIEIAERGWVILHPTRRETVARVYNGKGIDYAGESNAALIHSAPKSFRACCQVLRDLSEIGECSEVTQRLLAEVISEVRNLSLPKE